ncbi:glycosyltransferase [Oxalobacteraceae sp. CFBP 8755]|nr:glycosyltransferase [Oxalobacteraceae sp. CFBP 8755]
MNTKHALADRTEKYDLPVFAMGNAIPKQIHQCFFGARTFTGELAHNVDFIKGLNPDWTHTRYDEPMMKQFIMEHYGTKILRYYERINPNYGAARADLFRYLLLYKVGGAYLDIKSTMTRPFDDFITPSDRYLLGQWDDPDNLDRLGWGIHRELAHIDHGEYQQWHIICAPGHPFLRAVILSVLANIDRYLPWRNDTGAHGTFRLTGPVAYTLAIHPLTATEPCRLIHSRESGLVYSILNQRSHAKLFTSHYYRLTESIVKLNTFWTVVGKLRHFKGQTKALIKRQAKKMIGRPA